MFRFWIIFLRQKLRSSETDVWTFIPDASEDNIPAIPESLRTALSDALSLTNDEILALTCAYTISLDSVLARDCARVSEFKRPCALTREALCHIFHSDPPNIERRFRSILLEAGTPIRMGLVSCDGPEIKPSTSLRSFLAGRNDLPTAWHLFATLHRDRPSTLITSPDEQDAIQTLTAAWTQDAPAPLTHLIGPSGCGKTLLARHLCTTRSLNLLVINACNYPPTLDPLEIVREAKWLRAAVLLRLTNDNTSRDQNPFTSWISTLKLWLDHNIDVLTSSSYPQPLPSFSSRNTLWQSLSRPSAQTLRQLWHFYLPPRLRSQLTDDQLAFLFRGTGRDIAHMSTLALDRARTHISTHTSTPSPRVQLEDLLSVAVQTMTGKLTQLGALESPLPEGLRAVVLADEQRQSLEEIVSRVQDRQIVLDTWGFAKRLNQRGVGTIALFSGPPGTGKTLSARAVASELGLMLYRIDLSQVVSKWVGETEKHLGALFDDAEASGAALLFDEADALFAKRTNVKSSNDRYANLEVGFLLQRLESFTSVCFLTTNLLDSIDTAFLRRLSVHVNFKMPGEEERLRLWNQSLPSGAPVKEDLNVSWLAKQFAEMSGGLIRNAALRAAFIAASRNVPIHHDMLATCAKEEQAKSGALVKY